MLVHRLPFYERKRSPGPWPWADFRDSGLPKELSPLPTATEADQVSGAKEYSTKVFEGWKSDAGAQLRNHWGRQKPGSLYQIVCVGGKLRSYPAMEKLLDIKPTDSIGNILFIENLTEPLMQELGTKYDIDPDYFRACVDMIVSQSVDKPFSAAQKEDHIRFSLPFLRSRDKSSRIAWTGSASDPFDLLAFDHLGIYMVRSKLASTIVALCSSFDPQTIGSIRDIYSWVARTGEDTFPRDVNDPTFLIFSILWYTIYAWSDALGKLYSYLDSLESAILESPSIRLTQRFHAIRIHLLNYTSLLEDLRKTVGFVRSTPNPHNPMMVNGQLLHAGRGSFVLHDADLHGSDFRIDAGASNVQIHDTRFFNTRITLEATPGTEEETQQQTEQKRYLKERMQFELECDKLDREITTLEESVNRRNDQIKDVMNMVFSHVTIGDSAAMKQISWVTMFFIPATFVAGVFGMNVTGIGVGVTSLITFIKTAIPFTAATIWVLGALLPKSGAEQPIWKRFFWPWMMCVVGVRKLWSLMMQCVVRVGTLGRRRKIKPLDLV